MTLVSDRLAGAAASLTEESLNTSSRMVFVKFFVFLVPAAGLPGCDKTIATGKTIP
jgi:hypothetical protein